MHIREIPVTEYRQWLASLPHAAADAAGTNARSIDGGRSIR
ncbi:MAG TPA: hypothetical protein VGO26_02570 [Amnibacterium sp.]|jgi:hypothetical protein|nr:hypothetical protein [Amnibacterium sp.]